MPIVCTCHACCFSFIRVLSCGDSALPLPIRFGVQGVTTWSSEDGSREPRIPAGKRQVGCSNILLTEASEPWRSCRHKRCLDIGIWVSHTASMHILHILHILRILPFFLSTLLMPRVSQIPCYVRVFTRASVPRRLRLGARLGGLPVTRACYSRQSSALPSLSTTKEKLASANGQRAAWDGNSFNHYGTWDSSHQPGPS